jgi:hypothetical protein
MSLWWSHCSLSWGESNIKTNCFWTALTIQNSVSMKNMRNVVCLQVWWNPCICPKWHFFHKERKIQCDYQGQDNAIKNAKVILLSIVYQNSNYLSCLREPPYPWVLWTLSLPFTISPDISRAWTLGHTNSVVDSRQENFTPAWFLRWRPLVSLHLQYPYCQEFHK